jgi:hypothetical protein
MTYTPKQGDAVTVRQWAQPRPERGPVRRLFNEDSGTVRRVSADASHLRLAGSDEWIALGTHVQPEAEPMARYLVTVVDLQPPALAGRHVRIRRYQVPSAGVPGAARQLDCDVEGTVARVTYPHSGGLVELDPASAVVHYLNKGHDQAEPFGSAWRVGLGWVFLGPDADGGSWCLETEVEVDPAPEPASSTPLADALAEADKAQAAYVAARYHGTDEYLDVLERLAEAVRVHLLKHPERGAS